MIFSTLSWFSFFLVLFTVCEKGSSSEENNNEAQNIHSTLHTGSVEVPLYKRNGNEIYGRIIRNRYVYNPNATDAGMNVEYTAKSPWLENFLNEVAERKYMELQGESVQLKAYDNVIWGEMRRAIVKQFRKDLIIVSYDQKTSDWVLCTSAKKWVTKERVLRKAFKMISDGVRVCCSYKLLFPKREILRKPEPYWDYVPKSYIGQTVRSMRQFKRTGKSPVGTANEDGSKTILKHATRSSGEDVQTTTRTESDIWTIDLFDTTMDGYTDNCKLIQLVFPSMFPTDVTKLLTAKHQ